MHFGWRLFLTALTIVALLLETKCPFYKISDAWSSFAVYLSLGNVHLLIENLRFLRKVGMPIEFFTIRSNLHFKLEGFQKFSAKNEVFSIGN